MSHAKAGADPAKASKRAAEDLAAAFHRSLDGLRASLNFSSFAIAYSGGLDSSVLLHLAARYGRERGTSVIAFHINHGISPNADAWQTHCVAAAEAESIAIKSVILARSAGTHALGQQGNLESRARSLRYAALGALCREQGVPLLLTAHHQDDQAETVLLQLLRGSGPAGLSGMDRANTAPKLLGSAEITMARPLLSNSRAELEAYAASHGISHIDDESNGDTRFARNALRGQVMPILERAFPGYQSRFARSAAHIQSAQRLLDELAELDLALHVRDGSLDCAALRSMSDDRVNNMLRHWMHQLGYAMPSTGWLAEMVTQLREARAGAFLLVNHPECEIRRHRDRLYIVPHSQVNADQAGQTFKWEGQGYIAFPSFGGTLYFDRSEGGLDETWLKSVVLMIGLRSGGERLKLAANRPTRSLKQHYQALDVPAWEREHLPIIRAGKDVLYAAGIGTDMQHQADTGTITLRWTST
jgi:tRNA(Ile)-lysidine synthase